jgi:hypothetical protein
VETCDAWERENGELFESQLRTDVESAHFARQLVNDSFRTQRKQRVGNTAHKLFTHLEITAAQALIYNI